MDKAYIVANEQQEREVLEKLEREGYLWRGRDIKPTEKSYLIKDPITFFARDDNRLTYDYQVNEAYLSNYEIVYDGRKEERMSEKYVVSQEFMNVLEEWMANGRFVSIGSLGDLPFIINNWRITRENKESNDRLIAIIRWVNGEDVFEVEKPKKWVVRSKETDADGDYGYVLTDQYNITYTTYHLSDATRFDTKEKAQEWCNSHQETVEVEA